MAPSRSDPVPHGYMITGAAKSEPLLSYQFAFVASAMIQPSVNSGYGTGLE